MPTGYTARIQEDNFDLKEWLIKDIARGFGMCVCLRDSGKMSEKEIMQALEKNAKEAGSYHREKLEEIEKDAQKYSKFSQQDWEEEREKEIEAAKKQVQESKEKNKIGRAKYSKAKCQLSDMSFKVKGTIAEPMIKFAIEQINSSIDFDYPQNSTYYEDQLDKIKEMPQYRWDKEEEITKDKTYHTSKKIEDEEREKNRITHYKDYLQIINEAIQ